MITHQAIILIRAKVHELNSNGECVPPAVHDTGSILLDIKGNTKNEIKEKTDKLIEKVRQWISENQ
jgi:hypothetical protein